MLGWGAYKGHLIELLFFFFFKREAQYYSTDSVTAWGYSLTITSAEFCKGSFFKKPCTKLLHCGCQKDILFKGFD